MLDEVNERNMFYGRSTQGSLLHRITCFLSMDCLCFYVLTVLYLQGSDGVRGCDGSQHQAVKTSQCRRVPGLLQ